jgi:sec-independent protein translocase protein TatB
MGSPPPIEFATLGMWDTLLIMVLALVVFGPRRLPMIGRQLGKLMYEFRKASNDFKFQMEEELRTAEEADRRKKAEEERQRALAAPPTAQPAQLEATTSQTPAPAAETQEAAATQESGTPTAEEMRGTAAKIDSPMVSESTQSAETAPPASHSTDPESNLAPAETSIPHIQPPSTGEKIAADPPGKTQGSLFPEAEGSEPATHHG